MSWCSSAGPRRRKRFACFRRTPLIREQRPWTPKREGGDANVDVSASGCLPARVSCLAGEAV